MAVRHADCKQGIFWHINLGWCSPGVLLLPCIWASRLCPCSEDCASFLLLPFTFSVPSIYTGTSLSHIFNSFIEWWDDYVNISRPYILLRQATGGCCTSISHCIWGLILGWKCKSDKAKQMISIKPCCFLQGCSLSIFYLKVWSEPRERCNCNFT